MPRDKTRIYLSSTFEDLKAHRAAVYTALTKAGYDVQSKARSAGPSPSAYTRWGLP